jgi:two-component system, LytTR family, sensor kinase
MLTAGAPDLLHVVGYLTGATLYAMLLVMVVRAKQPDRLMVITAGFGLAWNVGELLVHAVRQLSLAGPERWLNATSYSALGLLAAAVVQSVARDPGAAMTRAAGRLRLSLPVSVYAVAGGAAAMHFAAALSGAVVPSREALMLLTTGLVVLAPALVFTTRRQTNSRRALWMTALTVFAVSALHLGSPHREGESWALELLGHHASIPLAFAILYEDYRFALADLFLKQALTLLALVTLVFGAWSAVVPAEAAATSEGKGILLALWVATALMFPLLRLGVTEFVDRFVLRRANYTMLLEQCATAVQQHDAEDELLDTICGMLAPALNTTTVRWEPRDASALSVAPLEGVVIHTADTPHYALVIGQLVGGRRLLSDDLTLLERVAALVARRIDALRLTNERYERMLSERDMRALATEAELRALRSQINPHFLFNALTTIGYLIQQAPPRALDTLMQLTTLLRGVLRSEGEFTTLGHERELIESYLRIERERFEERLHVDIDIPVELRHLLIPSLIVQPLVENAIKHGVANAVNGGFVQVSARSAGEHVGGGLRISVRNTGAPLRTRASDSGGVGLTNVARRLACYYNGAARLDLRRDADGSTVAELLLPLANHDDANVAVISRATST